MKSMVKIMTGILSCGLLTVLLTVLPFGAAAAQPDEEFAGLYNSYISAVKAKNAEKMIPLFIKKRQKELRGQMKNKKEFKELMTMARAMVPDSFRTEHLSMDKDGNAARMYVLAQYSAMPELERPKMQSLIEVDYAKEGGKWRLDTFIYMADPAEMKKLQDDKFTPEAANEAKSTNVGGRIIRVDFKPDHTLVVINVLGEENGVFLPKKEELSRIGIEPDTLKPWTVYEFWGRPHESDSNKIFATGGKLVQE